jgi:hypothetical protein
VRAFATPSVCIAHLVLRGSTRAAIVLLSRRRSGFSGESVAALKALLPAICIFARIGAGNRAELVRLAVLTRPQ